MSSDLLENVVHNLLKAFELRNADVPKEVKLYTEVYLTKEQAIQAE